MVKIFQFPPTLRFDQSLNILSVTWSPAESMSFEVDVGRSDVVRMSLIMLFSYTVIKFSFKGQHHGIMISYINVLVSMNYCFVSGQFNCNVAVTVQHDTKAGVRHWSTYKSFYPHSLFALCNQPNILCFTSEKAAAVYVSEHQISGNPVVMKL